MPSDAINEPQLKSQPQSLQRRIGLAGATAFGLGAILGTGVFVTVVTTSQQHGSTILVGIVLAAVAAICNGLSSAQLAAAFPVSGGTYEYGYRVLNPFLGFTAGWLFLCAKCASAATAALGAAHYLQAWFSNGTLIPTSWIAIAVLLGVGIISIAGIRWANGFNILLVLISLSALVCFVSEVALIQGRGLADIDASSSFSLWSCFQSAAIMFVAFTGYGRIATLGEEVHEPRQTIPRAVVISLAIACFVYITVALAVLRLLDVSPHRPSPQNLLELATLHMSQVGSVWLTVGALSAMLAVENNLLLGLSRVVLAMGRRGDLPPRFAELSERNSSPTIALILVMVSIGFVVLFCDFKIAWEFSALTVLVYYGITNLCALRLGRTQRLFPVWVAGLGLVLTISLAAFLQPNTWIAAAFILLLGWLVRGFVRNVRFSRKSV